MSFPLVVVLTDIWMFQLYYFTIFIQVFVVRIAAVSFLLSSVAMEEEEDAVAMVTASCLILGFTGDVQTKHDASTVTDQ